MKIFNGIAIADYITKSLLGENNTIHKNDYAKEINIS